MIALFIIIIVAGTSLHFTELGSDSAFYSVLLPIICFFSLIALTLWLVLFFHRKGINQRTHRRGPFGGFFWGGGDDGGCGGD